MALSVSAIYEATVVWFLPAKSRGVVYSMGDVVNSVWCKLLTKWKKSFLQNEGDIRRDHGFKQQKGRNKGSSLHSKDAQSEWVILAEF